MEEELQGEDLLAETTGRVRKCARRPTVELYAAGYLLRRVSDAGKPGRAEYQYRVNPEVVRQAHALLDA